MDRISAALFFDPIFDVLVLLGLALFFAGRRQRTLSGPRKARWGFRLAWLVWGITWLFATPRFSFGLFWLLEAPPRSLSADLGDTAEDRAVMVVLSGGNLGPRPGVWPAERLVGSSLPRAIGAARLYHERPVGHVIVTGRSEPLSFPDETAPGMADIMVAYGVPRERIILEPFAQNTRQNAAFSAKIVREIGADKVVVVTSALHMFRAISEFERAGLQVIGAPVDHRYEPPEGIAPYVPSVSSMMRTHQAMHEILGRFKP